MDSRMHFTFSDTIAGSVVAYQADEDTFTLRTIDGREFEVALTSARRSPRSSATSARPTSTRPARCATCSTAGASSSPTGSSTPRATTRVFEAKHIVFVGRTPHDFVFERPDWWVQQIREVADFYLQAQWPDGNIDYADYRTQITPRGRQAAGHAAGDGHDLAAGLRVRDRLPADRRGPLPRGGREGHRVPARPHAHGRRGRGHRLLGARRSTPRAARRRRSSPPSSATTTTRSRPTSRSTRSPARRRRSASRATRGSRATSSMTHRALQPLLPRPRGRGLLLAPRPDHVRPAQRVARRTTRRARTGTRSATTRPRT